MEIQLPVKKNQKRGGKKGRKIGRNKAFCQRYRASGRRLINKAKKAAREQRKQARCKA